MGLLISQDLKLDTVSNFMNHNLGLSDDAHGCNLILRYCTSG